MQRGMRWAYREQAADMLRDGKACVINLDDMRSVGTHWVAARVINRILYYADPFGTMLQGWPPKELAGLYDKAVVNRISWQRPSTALCGYYAFCFAMAMDRIKKPISHDMFEQVLWYAIA